MFTAKTVLVYLATICFSYFINHMKNEMINVIDFENSNLFKNYLICILFVVFIGLMLAYIFEDIRTCSEKNELRFRCLLFYIPSVILFLIYFLQIYNYQYPMNGSNNSTFMNALFKIYVSNIYWIPCIILGSGIFQLIKKARK